MTKDVDEQYQTWLKKQNLSNPPDEKEVKERVFEELSFLSKMDAREYTLYRKWKELCYKYPKRDGVESLDAFFGIQSDHYPELTKYKLQIWTPESPDDYKKLKPVLYKHNTKDVNEWNELRNFLSTMLNNANIGRQMFYTVYDGITNKILGLLCVSGDFIDLTPRDTYIGWSRQQKNSGMLNHTAIGSTIVPTQPLGYSFLGGKLIALLTISNVIERDWEESYDNKLVGLTTTSLYGSFSQYNNLQYWNKRGHSAGSIKYEPSRETVALVKEWLKYNHTRKYFEWYHGVNENGQPLKRDHKQRSLTFAYAKLKIPKEMQASNHQRGIYFCPLFTNTNDFLCQKIDKSRLIRRFDNSVETLTKIWKERYAEKRVKKLIEEGSYTTEPLFHDKLIGISWEEAKEKFLGDVGR